MMKLNSLHDLYVDQLRDLYDAERQLVQALPKMASAASSQKLKEAFEMHLDQTKNHVRRLDQIFSHLGTSPTGHQCQAMTGLIREGNEVLQAGGDATVKDAALIAAAQRVEHYEMAGYGTVRTYAKELGYNEAASLLQETLNEEGAADKMLTGLAEGGFFSSGINKDAKA
jgi:ferritin-like metal-binding protein YciE